MKKKKREREKGIFFFYVPNFSFEVGRLGCGEEREPIGLYCIRSLLRDEGLALISLGKVEFVALIGR